MSDNSIKPQIIPLFTFKDAFSKLFKCKPEDLEVDVISENREVNIFFKNNAYEIVTYDWLLEDVMDMLTEIERALFINIDFWREATYGVLSHQPFYDNLIEIVEDEKEAQTFYLSLSLSSLTVEKEKSFWNILYQLDKDGILFGKAIVAAAKTYNLNPLAEEILNSQIECGDEEYCQVDGGIFESIIVPVSGGNDVLYVYSIQDF